MVLLAAVTSPPSWSCPSGYSLASCDPSGTPVCGSQGGSYFECTLNNAYSGNAMEAYAVTGGSTLCGSGKDICVWGVQRGTSNQFCCNLNGTTETYLLIHGTDDGPTGDVISLQYDTYDLDNYDTGTIGVFEGRVQAGDGNDEVYGSRVSSADYRDKLFGGDDDDIIDGDSGDDELYGGVGHDDMFGGGGNDTMVGDAGSDDMEGNAGDDSMDGGSDQDKMSGGSGEDALSGGSEGDILCGDDDDDSSLNGGSGNDTIWGGAGADDYGDGGLDYDYCDVDHPSGCEDTVGSRPSCPGP